MKLLIMLVPMLMIGCDGSRESFTIAYDAESVWCSSPQYPNTDDCSCPSGFSRAGWTRNGTKRTTGSEYLEIVCLQD